MAYIVKVLLSHSKWVAVQYKLIQNVNVCSCRPLEIRAKLNCNLPLRVILMYIKHTLLDNLMQKNISLISNSVSNHQVV